MTTDRKVLVTGGCGSIGSTVVTHLLKEDSETEVTVYDNSEQSLFALEQGLGEDSQRVRFELGDVRDRGRLTAAMRGIDYVVHTAGVKQVPHCESHPHEAIRTNTEGTWNVIQVARQVGVDSVLTLSTDKAVNPVSTMGASKMLAERLTQAAECRTDTTTPRFGCVRLGNVVDSAGSVVRVFREQIEQGGPVTITDPNMTRFAMSKTQAAEFITERVTNQVGGRIHAPKIERFRLIDLAQAMIEEYAPPEQDPSDIDIDIMGARPGERPHEYLVGPTEVGRTIEQDGIYSIGPAGQSEARSNEASSVTDLPQSGYRSDTEPYMSHAEIIEMIGTKLDSDIQSSDEAGNIAVVGNDDSV